MPLSGALCVKLPELFVSLTVTSAVRVLATKGVKETCRLQLAPTPKVADGGGQPLVKENEDAFGPVSPMLVNVTGAAPGFFTLMVCAALVVPSGCGLNIRFGGVSVSTGTWEGSGGLGIRMPKGVVNGMVAVTVFVDVWMMESVLSKVFATYASVPSGVIATDCGAFPTGMVATTVLLAVLITDTLFEFAFTM